MMKTFRLICDFEGIIEEHHVCAENEEEARKLYNNVTKAYDVTHPNKREKRPEVEEESEE